MESHIWLRPAGSVALWKEGSKGAQWLLPAFCLEESCPPALALMPDTIVPPCMTLVPCRLLPWWCWSSKEVCLNKPGMGHLRGTAREFSNFFQWLQSCWFLQPEVMGASLPSIGTLGWGALCRTRTSHSQNIPPNFYPPPNISMGPTCSMSLCLLPVWINVVSLVP